VDVEGLSPVECFVWSDRVEELPVGLDFATEVEAVVDLVPVEVLVLQGAVPPTPFESTYYESTPTARRYEKIVRFSTIGPVKAGWLIKEKGQWSLTEDGRKAYEEFTPHLRGY